MAAAGKMILEEKLPALLQMELPSGGHAREERIRFFREAKFDGEQLRHQQQRGTRAARPGEAFIPTGGMAPAREQLVTARFANWDPHGQAPQWGHGAEDVAKSQLDAQADRPRVRRPRPTVFTSVTDLLTTVDSHTRRADAAAAAAVRALRSVPELSAEGGDGGGRAGAQSPMLAGKDAVMAPRLLPPLAKMASLPDFAQTAPVSGRGASPARRRPGSSAGRPQVGHVRMIGQHGGVGREASPADRATAEAWLNGILTYALAARSPPRSPRRRQASARQAFVRSEVDGSWPFTAEDLASPDERVAADLEAQMQALRASTPPGERGGEGYGSSVYSQPATVEGTREGTPALLAPRTVGLEVAGLSRAQLAQLGVDAPTASRLYTAISLQHPNPNPALTVRCPLSVYTVHRPYATLTRALCDPFLFPV
ncbi:hypothetical protein T492DRAFT_837832 [Pavlovales sp. CCMP2436]|nr:hypothetical protein T492DRAFT_837832 [Pavlovales sp. CCMP2436]